MANAIEKKLLHDNNPSYITFFELCSKVDSSESALEFALKTHILPSRDGLDCKKCNAQGSVKWMKRLSQSAIPFILFCPRCRTKYSISKSTVFWGSNITLKQFFQNTYCWLLGLPPKDAAVESNLSLQLTLNHYNFNREVCYIALSNESKVLGGPGHTIEISDLTITRRRCCTKQSQNREKEIIWAKEAAYIGYDLDTKEMFILKVGKVELNTLLDVVTTMVLPNSRIIVDSAHKYSEFEIENYEMTFVKEAIGTLSKSEPKRLKIDLPLTSAPSKLGSSKEFSLHLLERLYMDQLDDQIAASQKFYPFLADLAKVYPGYGKVPLGPLTLDHFTTV